MIVEEIKMEGYISIPGHPKLICKIWAEHVLSPDNNDVRDEKHEEKCFIVGRAVGPDDDIKIQDKEHAKYFANCIKILDIYDIETKEPVNICLSVANSGRKAKLNKGGVYTIGNTLYGSGSTFEFYINEEVILNHAKYKYYDDGSIKSVTEEDGVITKYWKNILVTWIYNDRMRKIYTRIEYDQEQKRRLIEHRVTCNGIWEWNTLNINSNGTLRRSITKRVFENRAKYETRYDHGVEMLRLVQNMDMITVYDLTQECIFSTSDTKEGFKSEIIILHGDFIQVTYHHLNRYIERIYGTDGILSDLRIRYK